MSKYKVIIERCPDTGLFVGDVPEFPGAHSQGASFEEIKQNLTEVIQMLLDDDDSQEVSATDGGEDDDGSGGGRILRESVDAQERPMV